MSRARGGGTVLSLPWSPRPGARLRHPPPEPTPADGPRVVLVTLDGVRWQEVFRGADAGLLAATATRASPVTLAAYLRPGAQAARRALLPFLWDTLATRGQLFGNADRGSAVRVTNAARISYPGYHEMLTGFTRASITDNRPLPNPDVTVLEWLHRRPGFAGSVAALRLLGRVPLHPEPGPQRHPGVALARGRAAPAGGSAAPGAAAALERQRVRRLRVPDRAAVPGPTSAPACCTSAWATPTSGPTPAGTIATWRRCTAATAGCASCGRRWRRCPPTAAAPA